MADTVLVTGGVGTVGSEVVRRLVAAGERVRATAHFPDYGAETRARGIDYVEVDYHDRHTLRTAFDGVGRLFLIVPESPGSEPATRNLMEAAAEAGVRRVVKLSFLNADKRVGGRLLRWHHQAERAVLESGIPVTVLRPNLFMQNFVTLYGPSIVALGSLRLPLADARVSYVDVRDVADVAVAVLLGDGHVGREYDLTGPEAVSHEQIAAVLSRVTGRPIRYLDEVGSDARLRLERVGACAQVAPSLEELWASVRAGDFAVVSAAVRDLLGREPFSFERFATDHAAAFAPQR
jgi:uncharacterized protein YbjT (DUF2867 family)